MGIIVPITNIVSYINYPLLMLTSTRQYLYSVEIILALPPPLQGCAVLREINVDLSVFETYVFLAYV